MIAAPGAATGAVLADPEAPWTDFLEAARGLLHRLLLLPEQASLHAPAIDGLQYFQFVVFWALGGVLLLAAFWFTVRYRHHHREDEAPATPKVTAPLWLELGVGGGLLAMFVLWWVIGFQQYLTLESPPEDAMEVYVSARQWVWKFAYPDGPTAAGVLVVPQGRPVRVVLTSRDVIHSLFIPNFRLKKDAVPGRYTSVWFEATRTGRFPIRCAEFCGAGHSRMLAEVVVLPAERFDAWLEGYEPELTRHQAGEPLPVMPEEEPTRPRPSMAGRGLRIAAENGCLRCHTTDGRSHIGPTWRGLYGSTVPLENGDSVLADPGYLTMSMMEPEAMVVRGFEPVMPSFHGRLRPAEVAAIVEYIRSIRVTGTGPVPEPSRGEVP